MGARNLRITTWLGEEFYPIDEVAVPGIKVTAWWPGALPDIGKLECLQSIWPQGSATFVTDLDVLEDVTDGKPHQIYSYIHILSYPSPWDLVVKNTLEAFLDNGAAISWAGGWECFLYYSPSALFDGCCIACTRETGIVGSLALDEKLEYLEHDPTTVARLHAAVRRICVRRP